LVVSEKVSFLQLTVKVLFLSFFYGASAQFWAVVSCCRGFEQLSFYEMKMSAPCPTRNMDSQVMSRSAASAGVFLESTAVRKLLHPTKYAFDKGESFCPVYIIIVNKLTISEPTRIDSCLENR
jgi:hypothetical protein